MFTAINFFNNPKNFATTINIFNKNTLLGNSDLGCKKILLVLYKRSASRKAYIECKALSGNIKGETVTIEAVALKKYHFIGKG